MSPDMTIESVLADPVIGAVMRADKIEPQAFERFLRSAARTIEPPPRGGFVMPNAATATWSRRAARGLCCA